jgi:hypothetical protein
MTLFYTLVFIFLNSKLEDEMNPDQMVVAISLIQSNRTFFINSVAVSL